MTQEQFNVIMKIIKSGAPALADELCDAFVGVIKNNQELSAKVKELAEENKTLKCPNDKQCDKCEKCIEEEKEVKSKKKMN